MTDNWNTYWANDSNRTYWLKPDKAVINLLDKIDRSQVKNVLDLGCGIGRHALLFADAGFSVTAVDSSEESLSVLRNQVHKAGIQMKIIAGDYSDDLFPRHYFDLIIAHNVLYHGYRTAFQDAVGLIHGWLKPGGLFFFTCPTRKDGKYGSGDQMAAHTFRPLNSVHPGDIHYFSDEADILEMLREFSHVSKDVDEHYWENSGIQQFNSYWQILAVS
jgi:tellurite methyltransferase